MILVLTQRVYNTETCVDNTDMHTLFSLWCQIRLLVLVEKSQLPPVTFISSLKFSRSEPSDQTPDPTQGSISVGYINLTEIRVDQKRLLENLNQTLIKPNIKMYIRGNRAHNIRLPSLFSMVQDFNDLSLTNSNMFVYCINILKGF